VRSVLRGHERGRQREVNWPGGHLNSVSRSFANARSRAHPAFAEIGSYGDAWNVLHSQMPGFSADFRRLQTRVLEHACVTQWKSMFYMPELRRPASLQMHRVRANLENDVIHWHTGRCVVDERELARRCVRAGVGPRRRRTKTPARLLGQGQAGVEILRREKRECPLYVHFQSFCHIGGSVVRRTQCPLRL
jgi:hypothetical protein